MAEYFGPFFGVGATPATSEASWFYGNQQGVRDAIGEKALVAISNEPDAASPDAIDAARVQRAGELVDQIIDARLAALGYVTPVEVDGVPLNDASLAEHPTRILLKDVSAKLVALKLNEPRMLLSLSRPDARNAAQIDKILDEHRRAAEMTLNKVGWRQINLRADRLYDRNSPAAVYVPSYARTVPVLP